METQAGSEFTPRGTPAGHHAFNSGTSACGLYLAVLLLLFPPCTEGKEFLTEQEIAKIQDAREIDQRIQVYMDAALLRLSTTEDRLNGKESKPGDPLEFFSVEEMIEGYRRIMRSVMFNIDEAYQHPSTPRGKLEKALKSLQQTTEKGAKELEIFKKAAEEKLKEELWNQVNLAIEVNEGCRQGAQLGLRQLSEKKKP